MIDPEIEELLGAAEIAKLPEYRRNGRAAHVSTVVRHMLSGRLESLIVGGRRLSSRQAVRRMITGQNSQAQHNRSDRTVRRRQIEEAEKRLNENHI